MNTFKLTFASLAGAVFLVGGMISTADAAIKAAPPTTPAPKTTKTCKLTCTAGGDAVITVCTSTGGQKPVVTCTVIQIVSGGCQDNENNKKTLCRDKDIAACPEVEVTPLNGKPWTLKCPKKKEATPAQEGVSLRSSEFDAILNNF